jgi:hypothetical protein
MVGETVDFIKDQKRTLGCSAEIRKNLQRGIVKFHHLGLAHIEHMNEKICHHGFFERGIEGLYESMRQLANESHRVRKQQRLVIG